MADPLLFEVLKKKLDNSRSSVEVNGIKAEIEANKQLEFNSKTVLLRYADELAKCLLNRDLTLKSVIKQESSKELLKITIMIQRAVSKDDLAAAITLVTDSTLSNDTKAGLIVYLKKRIKLLGLN